MKASRLLAGIGTFAALMLCTFSVAHASEVVRFKMVPASATIARCLPDATAEVTVFLKEEQGSLGVDTFQLKASGLAANTAFAVFLTELSAFDTPPADEQQFGAVEYIGDFTTNAAGQGSLKVDAIIEEAFSFSSQRVRKELNNVIFWFADPKNDDACFAPGTGPITPFDGDREAGAAAMSSQNAPLP